MTTTLTAVQNATATLKFVKAVLQSLLSTAKSIIR